MGWFIGDPDCAGMVACQRFNDQTIFISFWTGKPGGENIQRFNGHLSKFGHDEQQIGLRPVFLVRYD